MTGAYRRTDMKLGLSRSRKHRGEASMKTVASGSGGYAAGLSSTVYPRDSILRLSLAARTSGSWP